MTRAFFPLHSHIYSCLAVRAGKAEVLDLLTVAKFGCPFHLVTYMASNSGSGTEDLLVMYEYDYSCMNMIIHLSYNTTLELI